MNWQLAIEEIAKLAAECIAVRDAGFTTDAFNYPRNTMELRLLCAFNGHPAADAVDPWPLVPRGWRYFPNKGMKKAWARVLKVAETAIW